MQAVGGAVVPDLRDLWCIVGEQRVEGGIVGALVNEAALGDVPKEIGFKIGHGSFRGFLSGLFSTGAGEGKTLTREAARGLIRYQSGRAE